MVAILRDDLTGRPSPHRIGNHPAQALLPATVGQMLATPYTQMVRALLFEGACHDRSSIIRVEGPERGAVFR